MPYFPPASSGGGAPSTATYITQTADATLSNEQALGLLATGLLKSTTTTGVVSIAVANTDYAVPMTDTIRSTDADLALAVNTFYYWDISGLTADRTATLPGTAAVGDMCAIFITTGDNAFEVLLTATAGDTLNGIAGGTEWSRLFITGECVLMRCTVANTTWVVAIDGRIPCKALMELTTAADGETAATFTTVTAAATPGVFTVIYDVGDVLTAASSLVTARRAGKMTVTIAGRQKDNGTSTNYFSLQILDGSANQLATVDGTIPAATLRVGLQCVKTLNMAVGNTAIYQYRSQAGGLGINNVAASFMQAVEELP